MDKEFRGGGGVCVCACVCVILPFLLALAIKSVKDKQRNTDITAKANLETAETMVRKRRLRWLGHVARMGAGRISRQLLVCRPETGKCTAGGQKLRWARYCHQGPEEVQD